MDGFLHRLAEWLGVALPADADPSFLLGGFPSGGAAVLVLMGLAVLGLFAWWTYRREGPAIGTGRRIAMVGLRSAALLLVALILLEPQLVWPRQDVQPGEVVVLLDTSGSMGFADGGGGHGAIAPQPDPGGDLAPLTRLEAAVAELSVDRLAPLRQLARDNSVRVFGYGADLLELGALPWSPSGLAPDAPPVERLATVLASLRAAGPATDPGGAVRAALSHSGNRPVAGVVWLSDGRRNRGDLPADVARWLAARGVGKQLALGFGRDSMPRRVGLERVDAPERVFVGDPYGVTVRLGVQGGGVADGPGPENGADRATVRLLRQGAGEPRRPSEPDGTDPDGSVLGSQEVPLPRGSAMPEPVRFEGLTSSAAGVERLLVEVLWRDGGELRRERQTVLVEVLEDRIRVLLLAGGPSPEYRSVRNLLLRDDSIDVSCWLQSAAADFPQDGDPGATLEALPVDAAGWRPFDAVVLLDPDPAVLPAGFAADLAERIRTDGVGLWWSFGELHTLPGTAPDGPLAPLLELLPVAVDRPTAERRVYGLRRGFPRPWPWVPADGATAGVASAVVRWPGAGPDAGVGPWAALPGFHVALPIARLKSGAAPLLVHGDPGLTLPDGRPMPVAAAQQAGAGRVLFTGSNETYRWNATAPDVWQGFWVRGLRWLHEGRLAAGRGLVRLRLAPEIVVLGDAVQVEADARRADGTPMAEPGLPVLWVPPEGAQDTGPIPWSLPAVQEDPGRFAGGFAPDRLGTWQLAPVAGGDPLTVQVVAPPTEPDGPRDDAALAALVGGPAGRVLAPGGDLRAALLAIPSRSVARVAMQRAAVWDNGYLLALLVALLTAEWVLRKGGNLL